jgi:hypothetical protein
VWDSIREGRLPRRRRTVARERPGKDRRLEQALLIIIETHTPDFFTQPHPLRIQLAAARNRSVWTLVAMRHKDQHPSFVVVLQNLRPGAARIVELSQPGSPKTNVLREPHGEQALSDLQRMIELQQHLEDNPGFVKGMWCGNSACEERIKEETGATSRCIPFEQEQVSEKCLCGEKKGEHLVYWAKAY